MHAFHVVRVVLGFSESFKPYSLICGFRSLKHLQQRTELDRSTVLRGIPRSRFAAKSDNLRLGVIIVNTDGAAAVQHLISSPSGVNSYQGHAVSNVCKQSSRDVNITTFVPHPKSTTSGSAPNDSGCSKERFLGTNYAVKTFVKKSKKNISTHYSIQGTRLS